MKRFIENRPSSDTARQPALSRRPLRHEPARDGDRETALPAVVPRAGGRSFGRRAGAGRLERIETRPDRSGIHHRTAAPGRARSPLDSGAMEPQRAERLPARHRRRLRHGVRRQPRPLRILGLPARQLRAAIPRLAQRGAGERHGRPAPAATAGRRGGLRRHGVVLPARTAALRPRPAVGNRWSTMPTIWAARWCCCWRQECSSCRSAAGYRWQRPMSRRSISAVGCS